MTVSSLTRTNCGPSLEARRALRRHTLSNRQLTESIRRIHHAERGREQLPSIRVPVFESQSPT
jgi:hypothetical protein